MIDRGSGSIHRREFLGWTGLAAGGAAAAIASPVSAAESRTPQAAIKVRVPGGIVTLTPLLDNAVRVRLSPDGSAPGASQFLVSLDRRPIIRVGRGQQDPILSLPRMRCVLGTSGALDFFDAGGRKILHAAVGLVQPSSVQGQPTLAVEQSFTAPEGERLFGGGQLQDGSLDIKRLSRRLTQVNTQVSVPFFLSSAGYAKLARQCNARLLGPAALRNRHCPSLEA